MAVKHTTNKHNTYTHTYIHTCIIQYVPYIRAYVYSGGTWLYVCTHTKPVHTLRNAEECTLWLYLNASAVRGVSLPAKGGSGTDCLGSLGSAAWPTSRSAMEYW